MKVKELMTAVSLKSCGPESKLHEAAKKMRSGNCGVLPVIDHNNKVVGIITDRDICMAIGKDHGIPAIEGKVCDFMTPNVHTVSQNDDIKTALKEMKSGRVGRIPVVDDKGHLEGIFTIHDLLKNSINDKVVKENFPVNDILDTLSALSGRYTHKVN